jgi:hypothetical protein
MYAADEFREIDRLADELLRTAEARYKFPTPVNDIVEAQRIQLVRDEESLFSPAILAQAPKFLREQVRAFKHKMLAGLVRSDRTVHLSPDGLEVQKRFWTCHEVGHDLCGPSQTVFLDSTETLAPAVRELFEREANYAATRLLFQGDIFQEEARGFASCFLSVKELGEIFGASIHSTLWLFVETAITPMAALVLRSPVTLENQVRFGIKTVYESGGFARDFNLRDDPPLRLSSLDHPDLKDALDYLQRTGEAGEGELTLSTRWGEETRLNFELFTNSYTYFLLLTQPTPLRTRQLHSFS